MGISSQWNLRRVRDRIACQAEDTTMLMAAAKSQVETSSPERSHFEGLVSRTQKQAYGLAYRLTGNAAEAEDLVQESYLRAYRFFHRYDPSLPFTSWLYRIMTNAHVDGVRRKNRLKTTSLEQAGVDGMTVWELPDMQPAPDRVMLDQSLDEHIQKALIAMTPEFRTAVLLADVEGMAYDEIADVMKTSVGTVRSRIHRGRRQLRNHLIRHSPKVYQELTDDL